MLPRDHAYVSHKNCRKESSVLKIKISMLLVVGLVMSSPVFASDAPIAINSTVTKELDLTYDGKPERVIYSCTGKSINDPVVWSISIISDGKTIYSEKGDGSKTDGCFRDEGYVSDCTGYEGCKYKWYTEDLLDLFLAKLSPEYDRSTPFKKLESALVRKNKATKKEAASIVANLRKGIQEGKAYGINKNPSPVTYGPIAVWVPGMNRFVEVWDE